MKKFKISSILVSLLLIFSIVFAACGGGGGTVATVDKIEVTKLPTKIAYIVGEQLDLTGGELTATYSDNTTEKVSLTDSVVEIGKPNMTSVGEKTVSVTYKSKSANFKITIAEAKLTVTFDLNYEGSTAQTEQVSIGGKVSAPADPERSGYAFLGWYVAADSNTKYNFDLAITQDVTIYARWGYTVEFNLNYTGAESTKTTVEIGGTVSAPANPKRDGYLFTDWYTTAACETEYDFTAAINANTVIYAGWQEISEETIIYTVTFVLNDGTGKTKEKEVLEGNTVTAPDDVTLEGATLEGWFADEELTYAYDFTKAVTEDITLYAKWTADKFTVTFHYNHPNNTTNYAVVEDVEEGTFASSIRPEDDPVIDGYYFAGWYTSADCTTEFSFTISNRINWFTHIYAKWLKQWEFQAEDTDFGEREASGWSVTGSGPSAFIMKEGTFADEDGNEIENPAHNGRWVANLHRQGLYVEFIIESDEEVFDAALILRISADFYEITLDKTNFEIKVNEQVIDYDAVVELTYNGLMDLSNKRPFTEHLFLENMHLIKGTNKIRFTMTDSVKYGEFGTVDSTAPMFDSIYVCSNANLYMEPVAGNY